MKSLAQINLNILFPEFIFGGSIKFGFKALNFAIIEIEGGDFKISYA